MTQFKIYTKPTQIMKRRKNIKKYIKSKNAWGKIFERAYTKEIKKIKI